MKKLALITATAMITSLSFAQGLKEKEVPTPVKASFQKLYTSAKETKWEKEKDNYEAEFEIEDKEYSVLMDVSGNILETELEISIDALPAKVKNYVLKNCSGQKIKEASKITDVNGNVTYETEIKGKDLLFDSNGNFIEQESEKKKK